MKVKCVSAPEKSLLEIGKIYTTEFRENGRCWINVFENMPDFAPMYGSFEITNFVEIK